MIATPNRRALLLLLTVAAVLVLVTLTQAAPQRQQQQKPDTWKGKKDFEACGGAKACMGVQKLDRIRRRSGMGHKTVDEVAQILDQDDDLVSALFALLRF
jgi:hypothetical protein